MSSVNGKCIVLILAVRLFLALIDYRRDPNSLLTITMSVVRSANEWNRLKSENCLGHGLVKMNEKLY